MKLKALAAFWGFANRRSLKSSSLHGSQGPVKSCVLPFFGRTYMWFWDRRRPKPQLAGSLKGPEPAGLWQIDPPFATKRNIKKIIRFLGSLKDFKVLSLGSTNTNLLRESYHNPETKGFFRFQANLNAHYPARKSSISGCLRHLIVWLFLLSWTLRIHFRDFLERHQFGNSAEMNLLVLSY